MSRSSNASYELLLSDDEKSLKPQHKETIRSRIARQWPMLLILVMVSYLTIAVTFGIISKKLQHSKPYSPANSAVTYQRQRLDEGDFSIYKGTPSEELDGAWRDLLTGLNIRVPKHELEAQQENLENAVKLPDGDYVGILAVYHQLHCLNSLRKIVFNDYYEDKKKINWDEEHTAHCIESIRRAIVCHADAALWGVEWIASAKEPVNKKLMSNAEVTCVNWDTIDGWARKRALEWHKFKLVPGPFEHESHTNGSLESMDSTDD